MQWYANGKLREVKNTPMNRIVMQLDYDAMGQRVAKHKGDTIEYYVRDPQGNVLAMYRSSIAGGFQLIERNIYGSSRVGVDTRTIDLDASGDLYPQLVPDTFYYQRHLGRKHYELSNHLGNVLATITDRRIQYINGSSVVTHFRPDVQSVQDYYAFGSIMPGRQWVAGKEYRYGFNAQEKDDEVYGAGNLYTAEFWEYDTRLGRRWNVDPVVKHHMSGYSTFSNNPIIFVDPTGSTDYYNKDGKWIAWDGVDNGEKKMVLKETTANIIISAYKDGKDFTMHLSEFRDIIDLPTIDEIKAMDNVFSRMELSGFEEGFAVGTSRVGGQHIATNSVGSSPLRFENKENLESIKNCDEQLNYIVHSHPRILVKKDDGSEEFEWSGPQSSKGDRDLADQNKRLYKTTQASVVLGYQTDKPGNGVRDTEDKIRAANSPGVPIQRSGSTAKQITYYDDLVDVATMDYKDFKKAVAKATKHDPKSKH